MFNKVIRRFKLLPVENPVATALILACLALSGPIIVLVNQNDATQESRADSALIVCQTQNLQNDVTRGLLVNDLLNAHAEKDPAVPYATRYKRAKRLAAKVPVYRCIKFAAAVRDNKNIPISAVAEQPKHPLDPAPRP